jgi:hypothetical protein
MCNYLPVRNWLIGLGIMVAAAVASALVAGVLSKALPAPLVWIAAICFFAAASWAAAGLAMALFAKNAMAT